MRRRDREQGGHQAGAGGLAEERHPRRVPAEGGDVVLHPLQGGQHVAQSDVRVERARGPVEDGEVEEAEGAQPIVHRHDHHVAAVGQSVAVVERLAARPEHVRPAVQPDHHRFGLGTGRRPDVQRQAVLVLAGAEVEGNAGQRGLRTGETELGGVGRLGPPLGRLRCPEPQVPDRRRRVPDALEHVDPATVDAADRAVTGVDNRLVTRHEGRPPFDLVLQSTGPPSRLSQRG